MMTLVTMTLIVILVIVWNSRLSVCKEQTKAQAADDAVHHRSRRVMDQQQQRQLQTSAPTVTTEAPTLISTTVPPATVTPSTSEPTSTASYATEVPTDAQDLVNWEYENVVAMRWNIQNPPQVSYNGLQFDMHFTVSDYVDAPKHVRYNLYSGASCGYEGDAITDESGVIITTVTQDSIPMGGGLNPRVVTVSNQLVPQNIAKSKSYQPSTTGDNDATITYCLRFSLWSGTDPGAELVNYVDVTVALTVDLKDDFAIQAQSLQAQDRGVETTDDEFFVDAFLCQPNGEPFADMLPFVQGEVVRVCVQPTLQAYDVGFRMRRIDKFTFVQGYTTQEAIINEKAASNGLTQLWCDPGVDQCMFETLLFAYFFQGETNSVGGNGIASLQFGASSSSRHQRNLRLAGSNEQGEERKLTSASSKIFSIPIFGLQKAAITRPTDWRSASSVKDVTGPLVLPFAVFLWTFL
jgi:hypothetical protein